MKKTMHIMGGILLSAITLSANAQESWDAQKNPTVDSIAAKYRDKIVTAPDAPGLDKIFPVIGQYETTTNPESPALTITLDEQNKGIVWVEGLPQGKVKALLTRSPATYKIPAQKNAEGKDVAEGTLIYDKDQHALSICIGRKYISEDPASVFSITDASTTTAKKSGKTKTASAWIYTGTKIMHEQDTAVN